MVSTEKIFPTEYEPKWGQRERRTVTLLVSAGLAGLAAGLIAVFAWSPVLHWARSIQYGAALFGAAMLFVALSLSIGLGIVFFVYGLAEMPPRLINWRQRQVDRYLGQIQGTQYPLDSNWAVVEGAAPGLARVTYDYGDSTLETVQYPKATAESDGKGRWVFRPGAVVVVRGSERLRRSLEQLVSPQ